MNKFGGPNGYGHIPDPEGVVTERQIVGATNYQYPLNFSMRRYGHMRLNQGQTSSCTAHAIAAAVHTALGAAMDAGLIEPITNPIWSPIAPYTLGRSEDEPDPTAPLVDNGAQPVKVLKATFEWGLPPAASWGNFPADPKTINERPTFLQLRRAYRFRKSFYARINTFEDERCFDIMHSLSGLSPLTVALIVDNAFENYEGGVLGAPDPRSRLGGHYVYVDGYSWDGKDPQSLELDMVNSWGDDWGQGGCATLGRAAIDQLSDIYAIVVHK